MCQKAVAFAEVVTWCLGVLGISAPVQGRLMGSWTSPLPSKAPMSGAQK